MIYKNVYCIQRGLSRILGRKQSIFPRPPRGLFRIRLGWSRTYNDQVTGAGQKAEGRRQRAEDSEKKESVTGGIGEWEKRPEDRRRTTARRKKRWREESVNGRKNKQLQRIKGLWKCDECSNYSLLTIYSMLWVILLNNPILKAPPAICSLPSVLCKFPRFPVSNSLRFRPLPSALCHPSSGYCPRFPLSPIRLWFLSPSPRLPVSLFLLIPSPLHPLSDSALSRFTVSPVQLCVLWTQAATRHAWHSRHLEYNNCCKKQHKHFRTLNKF